MNTEKAIQIIKNLKDYYPDAKCSLDFSTPFEMLVAVCLSAQCTDDRVNKTTPSLFARFDTPQDFANADINELESIIHPCGFYKNKARNLKLAGQMTLMVLFLTQWMNLLQYLVLVEKVLMLLCLRLLMIHKELLLILMQNV